MLMKMKNLLDNRRSIIDVDKHESKRSEKLLKQPPKTIWATFFIIWKLKLAVCLLILLYNEWLSSSGPTLKTENPQQFNFIYFMSLKKSLCLVVVGCPFVDVRWRSFSCEMKQNKWVKI